jgi:hypothetical protein
MHAHAYTALAQEHTHVSNMSNTQTLGFAHVLIWEGLVTCGHSRHSKSGITRLY